MGINDVTFDLKRSAGSPTVEGWCLWHWVVLKEDSSRYPYHCSKVLLGTKNRTFWVFIVRRAKMNIFVGSYRQTYLLFTPKQSERKLPRWCSRKIGAGLIMPSIGGD